MAQFSVDIQMSPQTVEMLEQEGFSLIGFKAVNISAPGGAPLVWLETRDLDPTTPVEWSTEYEGYTSPVAQIQPGAIINAAVTVPVDLGQTITIAPTGQLSVAPGTGGVISVRNDATRLVTTGLLQAVSDEQNPICAVPISPQSLDVFTPIEKVLLMFSNQLFNLGAVVEQAPASGALINLTGVTSRSVTFDINAGWEGGPGVTVVSAMSNMTPLLIGAG